MSNGTVGQTVRIRMSNGRLISGIVNEDGTIAASL
jgi:flagella basal body P-ring formation protein FlgA